MKSFPNDTFSFKIRPHFTVDSTIICGGVRTMNQFIILNKHYHKFNFQVSIF